MWRGAKAASYYGVEGSGGTPRDAFQAESRCTVRSDCRSARKSARPWARERLHRTRRRIRSASPNADMPLEAERSGRLCSQGAMPTAADATRKAQCTSSATRYLYECLKAIDLPYTPSRQHQCLALRKMTTASM